MRGPDLHTVHHVTGVFPGDVSCPMSIPHEQSHTAQEKEMLEYLRAACGPGLKALQGLGGLFMSYIYLSLLPTYPLSLWLNS